MFVFTLILLFILKLLPSSGSTHPEFADPLHLHLVMFFKAFVGRVQGEHFLLQHNPVILHLRKQRVALHFRVLLVKLVEIKLFLQFFRLLF